MADCIVNVTEDCPTSASEARMSSVEQHATLTSESSSPTLTAGNKATRSLHRPPKGYRWYFQELVTEEQTTDSTLTLSEEHLPPVKIDASKKSTMWNVPLPPDHDQGSFYDVVLGVSVQKLNIDCIESILFRFDQLEAFNFGFEYEVIRADELKRLSSKDGLEPDDNKETQEQGGDKDDIVFLWRLFFRCYGYEGGLTVTMLVNTWTDLPHEYGSLDLHFVELCANSPALYNTDLLYREHRPYASWLIDPNHSACAEYTALTNKTKSWTNFSLSGDGRFAALKTIAGEERYLEVWSLRDSDTARKTPVVSKGKADSPGVGDGDTSTQDKITPHNATPVAWMPLSDTDFDVSISWDGSLLALIDRTRWDTDTDSGEESTVPRESEFAVYHCSWDDAKALDTSPSRMSLVRYDVQRTCPWLKNCLVEGVFHMVDKSNPDPKDQLFITSNGVTIDVYSAFEAWTPLRSIVLDSTITSMDQAPYFGEVLFHRTRGRYLITSNESTAFTFDIVLGTLISFTSALGQEELRMMNFSSDVSENGSLIAIPGFRHVSVYRTRTWTLHGSYEFHEIASEERVSRATFLYNSSLLVVKVFDGSIEQTRPGYVLDVATMSLVDRMAPEGHVGIALSHMDGSEQGLVYLGHLQLWDMRLEDRIYQCGQRRPDRCTDSCKNPGCHDHDVQEGTSSSGLHFKTQRIDTSTISYLKHDKRSSLAVIMTDMASSQVKTMVILFAKYDIVKSATFYADYRYLLIVTGEVQMAWTVPTTFDGDFRLYMVLHAYYLKSWSICLHGFMRYHIDNYGEEFKLVGHITHPIPELMPSSVLLAGLSVMLEIYEVADPGLRQEILRFYGRTLNFIFDEHQTNIFTELNYLSNSKNIHVYCDFLKHLLTFPGTRWVPPQDMSVLDNPLAMILDKASTEPSAISLAQIFVDYCFKQAREEQDQHFLLPIYQCLHLIVDSKQQYSEFALNVYRDLAFFPAQSRHFIQHHHALANPLEFRWAFWRPCPWGLHQYKDQVMQLETVKIPSPPKGNFTREIFQASFHMLWRKAGVEGSHAESVDANKVGHPSTLFSWPQAIWKMVLWKCGLSYITMVECHPYYIETLDNPALMALVEYKWNTIGFNFWLVRFLSQTCYYILVITAIFLQIDGGNRVTEEGVLISNPGPEGVFIAIIVVAFVFLWLELVQFMEDKEGYIR
ncbi:MAG: hypothetical protein J3R72DRAFT_93606 [Linnemannia gamsii]|nr:MAG: hypothetical protein J3R72DRAFT_93606 [Linnemannia gamsii]